MLHFFKQGAKCRLESEKMKIIKKTLQGLIERGNFVEAGELLARAFSNAPITQIHK